MAKITQKEIMRAGIKWVNVEGTRYFLVSELKEHFPHVKVNIENLIESPMGKMVAYSDIELMSDFDLKINQALNFNPKAK